MSKKRSDGRIVVTKTINGKRQFFYGATRKEAQAKCDAALLHYEQRQQHGEPFSEIAAEWWQAYTRHIKSGTERAYRASYARVLDEFGTFFMRDITPAKVNTWILKMQAHGFAQSTAKNSLSVLSLIYKFWSVEYNGNYSPVQFIELPRNMPKRRREPPTPEQLAAVKAHPEGFGLAAWLFMYTGARLGEIIALQWQDVDFEKNTIQITKSAAWINNAPAIREPKTASGVRTVPLLAPLRPVLLARKGQANDYIIGGAQPLTSSQYRDQWAAYCRSIGLTVETTTTYGVKHERRREWLPTVTAHQFRHEYASALYAAGVGEMEAQRLLGHADIATTHRIYTHIRTSQLTTAADQLNAYFAEQAE